MRILLVGLGSIGQRHLKNLQSLLPESALAVLSSHWDGTVEGRPLPVERFRALQDALAWKPEATIVSNPAPSHISTARAFAEVGSHLFLEKPLSNTMEGVDELLAQCARTHRVLMVGYNLRFAEPIRLMKEAILAGRIGNILSIRASVGQYLPTWRPTADYRQTVSARADLGGGALLELSHEFDTVRWLAGEARVVRAQHGKVSDLEIDVEDTADILLAFHSGAMGNIHLDMLDHAGHRSYRVVGSKGTLVWESAEGDRVRLWQANGEALDQRPSSPLDRNDMYQAELRHFFSCIEHGESPLVTGEDAKRTLEVVLAAKQSAQSGEQVSL